MLREAQVPFGEHLDMAGDREAQNVSLALLLAWKVLLHFFRSLPQEKRVEYAKYIRQNKMVDSLLGVLFRLTLHLKVSLSSFFFFFENISRYCR